jgi:uncharacterized membrane protein YphA (DoxX/SURF4 family)
VVANMAGTTRRFPGVYSIVLTGMRLALAIVWISAGATKLLGFSSFQQVLYDHGLLSYEAIQLAWVLPILEVVLGAAVLAVGGSPRFPALRRATGGFSAGLLLLLSTYILLLPEEVFRTVGCGCQGFGLTISPSRGVAVGINIALAGLSWGVWKPRCAASSGAP